MVYKKYLKKGGKVFGPYYYESYREGSKIKKRYIGGEKEYKNWLMTKKSKNLKLKKRVSRHKKIKDAGKILFFVSLICFVFFAGLSFGDLIRISPMSLTGFAISENMSEEISASLYGNYEEEIVEQSFDEDGIGLEIKEPAKFSGQVVTKNKNKRMDFELAGGNLRLYFDLLNYSEFVEEVEEIIKQEVIEEAPSGVPSAEGKEVEEEETDEEIEETSDVTSVEDEEINVTLQDENVTGVEIPEKNATETEVEEVETNVTEEVEELEEEGEEELEEVEDSEEELEGGGITGNIIRNFIGITAKIIGIDLNETGTVNETAGSDGEISLEEVQETVAELNEEEIELIEDESVVEVEDFEIVVEEESEVGQNYKWGYKIKLHDLNFMAKIDVTSEQRISVWDENTLRIGNQLLSFNDLVKEGYVVRIETPALEIELEDLVLSYEDETNILIPKEQEEEILIEDINITLPEENITEIEEIETNETEEVEAEEIEAEEDEDSEDEESGVGITGNIIRGFAGISGFVVADFEESEKIEELEYEHTITIYIERDFANTSYQVGDVVYLDPTLVTLFGDTEVSSDYYTTADSVFINITASASAPANVSTFIDFDGSLISWWRMDDIDGSGNPTDYFGVNNGTAEGDANWTASGYMGEGFEFDGNDNVNLGDVDLSSIQNEGTISTWAYNKQLKTYGGIITKSAGTGTTTVYLDLVHYTSNMWRLFLGNGTNYVAVSVTDTSTNVWKLITATWNSSSVCIYVNGTFNNCVANTYGFIDYGANLRIGAMFGSATAYGFNGTIDDVMIFNRSLSAEEIVGLYANSSTKYLEKNFTGLTGSHTFKTYAQDTAGDVAEDALVTVVLNETDYPNVEFSGGTPTSGSSQAEDNIFVNVSASDATSNISTFIDFDNSLVGWWRMDDVNASGDPTDYLGVNNGTAEGDAVQTDAGKLGKGFEFDGSGDYVTVGTGTDFSDMCNNGCTFSAWINKVDGTFYGDILARYTSTYDDRFFIFYIDSLEYTNFAISENGNSTLCIVSDTTTATKIQLNTWEHVVAVYNTTDVLLYRDGAYTNDKTTCPFTSINETAWSDSERTTIGVYDEISDSWGFNGSIDDVMIFNRSLSADEILGLYANTSSKYLDVNFTSLAEGEHTFTAYTQDLAGNVNLTEERSVTIILDSTAPNVTINYPVNNSNYNSSSINFNVTAVDETAMSGCWFSLDSGVTNITLTNSTSVNDYNFTNSSMTEGSHTADFWCNDTNNNVNNSEGVTFSVDAVYPLISFGNGTLDDDSRGWNTNVYVNVSVTETSFKNISFNLYYSNGTLINSTDYVSEVWTINWTGLSGEDYKYNVSVYDGAGNLNSTATRDITLIGSQSNITLNSGWNLVSLGFDNTDNGTDRNVSVVAGWNLIGYSSNVSLSLGDVKFHNGSNEYSWANAISNNKVQAYLSYYDSSSATASLRKYKYTATSDFGMDDSSLRENKGYWVYMNESGNLTLPSIGGSLADETYDWSKLRFWNGTSELNVTDAGDEGWVTTTLQYWGPDAFNDYSFRFIDATGSGSGGKTYLSPFEGIFMWSNHDNITLIRQN